MSFAATWMNLEIMRLSKISQAEKDKYYMRSPLCGILKIDRNELIYNTETDSQTQKTN